MSFFCHACMILRNMPLDSGDDGEDFLPEGEPEGVEVADETAIGKRVRDALMFCVFNKLAARED